LDEASLLAASGIASMAELEVIEKGDQAMYIGNNDQQKQWKKLKQRSETSAINTPEKENLISDERRFLFNFWMAKDKESANHLPFAAMKEFYNRVEEANKKFSYMKTPGWETDFGRIYLKYGAPEERNIIKELHSIDSKPIIVWQYLSRDIVLLSTSKATTERMNTQINYNYPTFVFVDKEGGGKFTLVHSNVQGETFQPEWYIQEARRIR
jgi:GWxTD domain-containing protein